MGEDNEDGMDVHLDEGEEDDDKDVDFDCNNHMQQSNHDSLRRARARGRRK